MNHYVVLQEQQEQISDPDLKEKLQALIDKTIQDAYTKM